MNVKVENMEKNLVKLEIEIDAEAFEQGMKKAFQKTAGRYNVPGFRKGKAPRNMVERYYGATVLYDEAVNILCPEAYDAAVEENNLHPVDRPEFDIVKIGDGGSLIFTATVPVKPEVELGQYLGVEVEKPVIMVTEDDIEKELQKVADRNSRLVSVVGRPVQLKDTAVIDFEGFIDGVAFDGGKGENHSLEIGSGSFIPGFEEQLIGKNAGDEVDVDVTFPEGYGPDQLSGKPALFKVKIHEIKFKEIPVIDDEFAKDVSEFDTLDEYKDSLKKKLLEDQEHKAKHDTEDKIVFKAVDNAVVDVPEAMTRRQVDSMVRDFDTRLKYQGMELSKYLQMVNMDMEDFRSQFTSRAEKEVKTHLVLEKIGKVENVSAGEEELNTEITKLAESYKQEVEEFKKHLRNEDIEYIKNNLVVQKTIDLLVESAKQV